MAATTAVYEPPIEGLPFLAVVILPTGELDVTPFPNREDAEAYIEVCDAGLFNDAKRRKSALDGQPP